MEILVTNVSQAVEEGFHYLAEAGIEETSRNGKVIVAPEPVMTIYTRPTERVLFSPLRDANPFFHLMESLWMLAGRADVAWPAYFAKNMTRYSDDGTSFWGAYGRRWRNWFNYDQLAVIAKELQERPDSRRCVLAMWDAMGPEVRSVQQPDMVVSIYGGKDVPCNTHAYFDLRGGKLNLTVLCRSNDALWGAYGANAVHFSVLQEYMAAAVGAPVGVMRQFSNNFHVYPTALPLGLGNNRVALHAMATDAGIEDHYKRNIQTYPLVNKDIKTWDKDLQEFFNAYKTGCIPGFKNVFFVEVAWPMYRAWQERKEKRSDGLAWVDHIRAQDWKLACFEWIERREAKKAVTK